jgi:hypothetical protein
VFSYRDEKHVIEHTGFLAFDIDFADNQHISNFDKLKEQISHVVCVSYCGLSVRGKGFWGLVPIPKSTPAEHKYRFNALSKFFKSYNINLDPSGSDICRLRIYSRDPEGYFNHNAKLYTGILKPQAKKSTRPAYSNPRDRVEAIISQIKERRIDITSQYKEGWLKIASALANEFGESGRGYFHTVSLFNPKYNIKDTDRMFDECLKHNYNKITIASFFHIANEYGIKLKLEPVMTKTMVKTHPTEEMQSKQDPISKTSGNAGPWNQDIAELEKYFKLIKLPTEPIKLDGCSMITNVTLFIESHLSIVKGQNGNLRYAPYLDRLNELKAVLTVNLN